MASLDAGLGHWLADYEGRLRRDRFAVILAGSYVLFSATYLPINHFSVGRAAHTLFLPGEEWLQAVRDEKARREHDRRGVEESLYRHRLDILQVADRGIG